MPTFRTELFLAGKTATGLVVPPEIVDELGSGKRPKVRVTLNSYTYRSTVAPMDGKFYIPVSAENREGAGVTAGEILEVILELDSDVREVEIPEVLVPVFSEHPQVLETFKTLSYSRQKEYVVTILAAKTPPTQQKRIQKMIDDLS